MSLEATERMQGPVSPATAANHEKRVLATRLDQSVSKSDGSQLVGMACMLTMCPVRWGWLWTYDGLLLLLHCR